MPFIILFSFFKNQIYIFLTITALFIGCKTDSPIIEPDNIFYWKADNPKQFVRENSIIDYKSDVLSPITVNFESAKLSNNTYNTNLWLDGGDSLQFVNQDFCFAPLEIDQIISEKNTFSETISIDYRNGLDITCAPSDTFYIGFKRTYSQNYRTTFGWFRIIVPLAGFYILDEMGWNYANHQPSRVNEKN